MPEDRYRIPYSILEGVKAGINEWQRLRGEKKQQVMTKALLGMPLTPEEEKLLSFKMPPELTEMGKATEEKRRWEEEMGYKRELLKIKEKPKTTKEDILTKKDIETIKSQCMKQAINLSQKETISPMGERIKTVDPDLFEKNYELLLRKRLPGQTPLNLKKYLPFLGAYPYTPSPLGEEERPSLDEIFGE